MKKLFGILLVCIILSFVVFVSGCISQSDNNTNQLKTTVENFVIQKEGLGGQNINLTLTTILEKISDDNYSVNISMHDKKTGEAYKWNGTWINNGTSWNPGTDFKKIS